jgi:hypothetical protein
MVAASTTSKLTRMWVIRLRVSATESALLSPTTDVAEEE